MMQENEKSRGIRRWFAVCLILFGLVVIGRGLNVQPLHRMADSFQETLTQIGTGLSRGESAVETFRGLWTVQNEDTP